ncbi:MAG: hypothetical protein U0457_01700 [Candidatus Sericytochromatia bacterium]
MDNKFAFLNRNVHNFYQNTNLEKDIFGNKRVNYMGGGVGSSTNSVVYNNWGAQVKPVNDSKQEEQRGVTDSITTVIRSPGELETLTKGRNAYMPPDVYAALARGEEVRVTLTQKPPERVNLLVPVFALFAQMAGSGGAAYNDKLGEAIQGQKDKSGRSVGGTGLNAAAEFINKYGNDYSLNPFGGATHIDINAQYEILGKKNEVPPYQPPRLPDPLPKMRPTPIKGEPAKPGDPPTPELASDGDQGKKQAVGTIKGDVPSPNKKLPPPAGIQTPNPPPDVTTIDIPSGVEQQINTPPLPQVPPTSPVKPVGSFVQGLGDPAKIISTNLRYEEYAANNGDANVNTALKAAYGLTDVQTTPAAPNKVDKNGSVLQSSTVKGAGFNRLYDPATGKFEVRNDRNQDFNPKDLRNYPVKPVQDFLTGAVAAGLLSKEQLSAAGSDPKKLNTLFSKVEEDLSKNYGLRPTGKIGEAHLNSLQNAIYDKATATNGAAVFMEIANKGPEALKGLNEFIAAKDPRSKEAVLAKMKNSGLYSESELKVLSGFDPKEIGNIQNKLKSLNVDLNKIASGDTTGMKEALSSIKSDLNGITDNLNKVPLFSKPEIAKGYPLDRFPALIKDIGDITGPSGFIANLQSNTSSSGNTVSAGKVNELINKTNNGGILSSEETEQIKKYIQDNPETQLQLQGTIDNSNANKLKQIEAKLSKVPPETLSSDDIKTLETISKESPNLASSTTQVKITGQINEIANLPPKEAAEKLESLKKELGENTTLTPEIKAALTESVGKLESNIQTKSKEATLVNAKNEFNSIAGLHKEIVEAIKSGSPTLKDGTSIKDAIANLEKKIENYSTLAKEATEAYGGNFPNDFKLPDANSLTPKISELNKYQTDNAKIAEPKKVMDQVKVIVDQINSGKPLSKDQIEFLSKPETQKVLDEYGKPLKTSEILESNKTLEDNIKTSSTNSSSILTDLSAQLKPFKDNKNLTLSDDKDDKGLDSAAHIKRALNNAAGNLQNELKAAGFDVGDLYDFDNGKLKDGAQAKLLDARGKIQDPALQAKIDQFLSVSKDASDILVRGKGLFGTKTDYNTSIAGGESTSTHGLGRSREEMSRDVLAGYNKDGKAISVKGADGKQHNVFQIVHDRTTTGFTAVKESDPAVNSILINEESLTKSPGAMKAVDDYLKLAVKAGIISEADYNANKGSAEGMVKLFKQTEASFGRSYGEKQDMFLGAEHITSLQQSLIERAQVFDDGAFIAAEYGKDKTKVTSDMAKMGNLNKLLDAYNHQVPPPAKEITLDDLKDPKNINLLAEFSIKQLSGIQNTLQATKYTGHGQLAQLSDEIPNIIGNNGGKGLKALIDYNNGVQPENKVKDGDYKELTKLHKVSETIKALYNGENVSEADKKAVFDYIKKVNPEYTDEDINKFWDGVGSGNETSNNLFKEIVSKVESELKSLKDTSPGLKDSIDSILKTDNEDYDDLEDLKKFISNNTQGSGNYIGQLTSQLVSFANDVKNGKIDINRDQESVDYYIRNLETKINSYLNNNGSISKEQKEKLSAALTSIKSTVGSMGRDIQDLHQQVIDALDKANGTVVPSSPSETGTEPVNIPVNNGNTNVEETQVHTDVPVTPTPQPKPKSKDEVALDSAFDKLSKIKPDPNNKQKVKDEYNEQINLIFDSLTNLAKTNKELSKKKFEEAQKIISEARKNLGLPAMDPKLITSILEYTDKNQVASLDYCYVPAKPTANPNSDNMSFPDLLDWNSNVCRGEAMDLFTFPMLMGSPISNPNMPKSYNA